MFCVFRLLQEVKSAILEDIVKLGKEGGLKSFEQVSFIITNYRQGVILHDIITACQGLLPITYSVFMISNHIMPSPSPTRLLNLSPG